ncbi:MAG: anti-phage ZorAB system protein ZorA, partial [Nitrospinota bacterium]
MNQMPLDYTNLIPKFGLLWEHGIAKSDGLSAAIVLVIFVIFGFSFLWVFIYGIRHYLIIKAFHKAFSGVTSENLITKHVEIKERLKSNKLCSDIWSEFCESLVKSKEKQKIYNTLDSSHFINTHTLASKVTESRLLAAVPGILTAIGVIGTFMGLLLGLHGIKFDVDIELMKSGIGNLISAASVAFMTSVWGVGSSVFFNVVEKIIENILRSKIARLQETVDLLYSRKIAEQSLDVIEFNTRESTVILQNLGEDLGSRLQNAVKAVSSEMQTNFEDSLRNVMVPAIDKLVNASKDLTERQAGGSEQALESILSSFMDKFSQQGDMQREMLTDASQCMKSATNSMASEMAGFMGRLEKQIQYMEQEARQRNSLLEGHVENSISTQASNTDYMKEQMEQVFTALLSGIERRDKEDKIQESHKREAMQNAINQIAENQERLIESTRKTTSENIEATQQVVERTESLTNSIGSTQEA